MNFQKILGASLHVTLFMGGLLALLLATSIALRHPVSRSTLALVFVVTCVVLIMAGCAWILRKLWEWSGVIAAKILPAELGASPTTLAHEGEGKGSA